METSEILKKVRQIEIKTRRLSANIFAGQYHTAFKGKGMAFSEVREYQYGDDVRDIDWNVTARFNKPYIKVFEENGIHFDYINENPEVDNNELGNFDKKLYFNIGIDDKFGFDAENGDWM